MKLGWIAGGETFPHKEKLKELGFKWNGKLRVWYGVMSEGGHDQEAYEKDLKLLNSMKNVFYKVVDLDCLREGNEKWFDQEVKDLYLRS